MYVYIYICICIWCPTSPLHPRTIVRPRSNQLLTVVLVIGGQSLMSPHKSSFAKKYGSFGEK